MWLPLLVLALAAPSVGHELDVLYVSGASEVRTARRAAMVGYLDERFATVRQAAHGAVTPALLDGIEVVVLDWHQTDGFDGEPLGPRASWSTPTVLLGSAGLLTAKKWEVLGGSG